MTLELLRQPGVTPLLLDGRTVTLARTLLRRHKECKKPNDGVHLASAILANVDGFHTFDRSDLLKISTTVNRSDGFPLKICLPTMSPPSPSRGAKSTDPSQASIFGDADEG